MNLKDLSGILGLSPTTVSRALNDYPEVSERTRRRVKEAAIMHDYSPDARARRLATGRSMTIGHVIPVSKQHEMVNPIFADFITGAGEAYSHAGYDLKLSLVADGEEDSFYRNIARRGSVDGVIVHSPKVEDPRIDLLLDLGIPFVVHGRSSGSDKPYSWVDVNNHAAMKAITQHLIDLGHTRIALINGLEWMDFAERRHKGYAAALESNDLVYRSDRIAHGEMTEHHGYEHANRMLNSETPPTAFVVSSTISAIGVRRAAVDIGLEVGERLSIAVFDDDLSYFRVGAECPAFTAVRSSVRAAGRLAGDMILDIISGKRDAPLTHLLEAEFVQGQSSGPTAGRAQHRKRDENDPETL